MDYTKNITIHIKGKHFSIGDRRELQPVCFLLSTIREFIRDGRYIAWLIDLDI